MFPKNIPVLNTFHDTVKVKSDAITDIGGVAQLGERVNGIHEVAGSIPAVSKKWENFSALAISVHIWCCWTR